MKIYNMQIHAIIARIMCVLFTLFLVTIFIAIILYLYFGNIEFNNNWFMLLLGLFGAILLSIFFIPIVHNTIIIEYDMIRMQIAPLISPKIGFEERARKDYWNLRVRIPEIKRIEIRKLARHEKWNIGNKFLFRKYMVIETQKGQYKYMPVGTFTKKQIQIVLDYINNFEYDEKRM